MIDFLLISAVAHHCSQVTSGQLSCLHFSSHINHLLHKTVFMVIIRGIPWFASNRAGSYFAAAALQWRG